MFSLAIIVSSAILAALQERYDSDHVEDAYRDLIAVYAREKNWSAVKWIRSHQPEIRNALGEQLRKPKGTLFERFSPRSLPQIGEKGYRSPPSLIDRPGDLELRAKIMLGLALELWEEPEIYSLFRSTQATLGYAEPGSLAESSWEDVREFANYLAIPDSTNAPGQTLGRSVSLSERGEMALFVMELAGLTRDWISPSGQTPQAGDFSPEGEYTPSYPDQGLLNAMPVWVAEAILADTMGDPSLDILRLVIAPRDQADAFIRKHHSVLGKEVGEQADHREVGGVPYRTLFIIGAALGDRLVAVATAGHPSGRWKTPPQQNVLELTRIASDGTVPNASSMLAARMLDLAPRSLRGPRGEAWLFVTYSLLSESGATYESLRGKGLRPVAVNAGRSEGGGGRRSKAQAAVGDPKIVWEAGPAARPARWFLLQAAREGAPEDVLVKASRFVNPAPRKGQVLREPDESAARGLLAEWLP